MTEDNRIPEIREALSELDQWEHDSAHRVVERIQAILDSAPPAPRVFLPGDMVPKGTATVMPPLPSEDRAYPYVMHEAAWDYAVDANYPVVELPLPSVEYVRAAIERAQAERADASRASEERAIPEPTEGTTDA